MRTLLTCALLLVLAGAAGCGGDANAAAVSGVAGRFLKAVGSGDGQLACAQLSTDARAQLEKDEGHQCRVAVSSLHLKPGSVTAVHVYVLNAMVELSSGETEFLEEGSQGWRLTAVGCTPGPKPRDEPYDCQLED